MGPAPAILVSLGLDQVIGARPVARDPQGNFTDALGARMVFAGPEMLAGLNHVLERERAGSWRVTMKSAGRACGRRVAVQLESELTRLAKPALAALPLEACLALLERTFSQHGWGRLQFDLRHADRGVVAAYVDSSCFTETLGATEDHVDVLFAGVLVGFFEHITGESLDAEQIGRSSVEPRRSAFVLAAPDRLAAVASRIGQDPPEAIITELAGTA